jgi:hypothetical protein
MYGVGLLKFKGETLGYILKDSFNMNPTKGETSKVWAEQVQSAPVKSLAGTNGTIAPSFNLIEIDYEVMQSILGGTLVRTGETVTGWKAPREVITIEGEFVIETKSKHRITIFNGLLQGTLGGGLNMTSVSQIEVAIEVQMPDDPDEAPYQIEDIAEI